MLEISKVQMINKGHLLAKCDVRIPAWKFTIHNVSIFEKNGSRWVSMPSQQYEKDGQKKFFPHCRFDDMDILEKFQSEVKKLFETWILTNPQNEQAEPKTQKQDDLPF